MHFPGLLAPDSVSWRWEAVTEAAGLNEHAARLLFKDEGDELLLRAHSMKSIMDRAGIAAGKNWWKLLPERDRPLAAAYTVYSDRPKLRWFIEGMLLAGVKPEEFAQKYGYERTLATDVVQAYHDLFFDVKDRLDQHGWVVECLFNGALYASISKYDTAAIYHRLAWLGGAEIFRAFYESRPSDEIRTKLVELIREVVHRQSIIQSFCINNLPEQQYDGIKLMLDETHKAIAKTVGDSTSNEAGAAVKTFLSRLHMEVADVSNEANLNLPAREPRVADYIDVQKELVRGT